MLIVVIICLKDKNVNETNHLHCLINNHFASVWRCLHAIWPKDLWSNCRGHKNPAFYANYVIISKKIGKNRDFWNILINVEIFRDKIGIYGQFLDYFRKSSIRLQATCGRALGFFWLVPGLRRVKTFRFSPFSLAFSSALLRQGASSLPRSHFSVSSTIVHSIVTDNVTD